MPRKIYFTQKNLVLVSCNFFFKVSILDIQSNLDYPLKDKDLQYFRVL